MKTIISLDEKDIAKILAEKFKCDVSKVNVLVKESWVGFGPMERKLHRCAADIEVDLEVDHAE